jgi:glycosyltransferase involved in cell wall biosynthesis
MSEFELATARMRSDIRFVGMHASRIRASVIVPMRNEALHIQACLASLLEQTIASDEYEIIVVDGQSVDGSGELVWGLQTDRPNIILLQNPSRTMPAGMNIGLRHARGDVIIVAGAHTVYPPEYVERSLRFLEKTGADVVGGPVITVASCDTFAGRMIATLLSCRFGVGDSAFRTRLKAGFVDTVPFGAYRREIFERVGVYNERLVRIQDHELHCRIRQNGGRIYITPELTTAYRTVPSYRSLCKKGFNTGLWQFYTLSQNPSSFSLRHFVPLCFVLWLGTLIALAIFTPGTTAMFAVTLALYMATGFRFGASEIQNNTYFTRLLIPIYAFPFHFSYGMGTIVGLWYLVSDPTSDSSRTQRRKCGRFVKQPSPPSEDSAI